MLTIILTSFNRPCFVQRAIDSVLGQVCDSWRLIIQDDGSDTETVNLLREYRRRDERIELRTRRVTDTERQSKTRYSVLINEVLDELSDGIVGYMCDNVEYAPDLVGTVLRHFSESPAQFAGYVRHARDVYTTDGVYRGTAASFGHWNHTPPMNGAIDRPMGLLDHSQVFHRMPVSVRWNEDRSVVKCGDGDFFTRLARAHGAIAPIRPGVALTQEHLFS